MQDLLKNLSKGDKVFLIGLQSSKYSNKVKSAESIPPQEMPKFNKQKILKKFSFPIFSIIFT